MVKCPNCNHIFNIGSLICPRKVSITKRDKIARLTKQIKKNTNRAKKFNEVIEIIDKRFQDKDITSKLILQIMGWSDHSDGDVTLTFLDALICRGELEKTRHKKGIRGHLYKINPKEICPYFIEGKCTCNLDLYKHIDEEEEG
jgi:hypothetical protein